MKVTNYNPTPYLKLLPISKLKVTQYNTDRPGIFSFNLTPNLSVSTLYHLAVKDKKSIIFQNGLPFKQPIDLLSIRPGFILTRTLFFHRTFFS
jgi:hypothetical protein